MPRTCTSRALSSSSESESTSPRGTVPSATLRARSVMAASFGPLTPAAGSARTAVGSRPSANSFMNRPRIAVAAAPASCWYMIERTRAPKPSRSGASSSIGPERLMSLARAGSFWAISWVPFAIWRRVATRALGKLGHELREVLAREAQVLLTHVFQRAGGDLLCGREVVHLRVHVEQPGHEVTLRPSLLDDADRCPAVGWVMVLAQLLEHDVRAVVQAHVAHGARLVVDVHLFEEGDERDVGDGFFVVL